MHKEKVNKQVSQEPTTQPIFIRSHRFCHYALLLEEGHVSVRHHLDYPSHSTFLCASHEECDKTGQSSTTVDHRHHSFR